MPHFQCLVHQSQIAHVESGTVEDVRDGDVGGVSFLQVATRVDDDTRKQRLSRLTNVSVDGLAFRLPLFRECAREVGIA